MCASEHGIAARNGTVHPPARKVALSALAHGTGVGIRRTNQTRVDRVRNALIEAGVPAYKIQTGSFDKPQLRRDGRVAVLVSSR